MPTKNERQKLLDDLERGLYQASLMEVFDDDKLDDPSETSLLDELAGLLVLMESNRYLVGGSRDYRGVHGVCEEVLQPTLRRSISQNSTNGKAGL